MRAGTVGDGGHLTLGGVERGAKLARALAAGLELTFGGLAEQVLKR